MKIYCIEDCNGLKYIGSTKQHYLCNRLSGHRQDKKNRYGDFSSCELDLDNCEIYLLEESTEKDREKYWINKIECVNHYKLNFNKKEYKQKKEVKQRGNECQRIRRQFKNTWGGNPNTHNNLLNIDLSIFI